jgi:hypothetical protein
LAPGPLRAGRRRVHAHYAGSVPSEHAARQVGFMSTQKWVSRWHRTSGTERAGEGSASGSLAIARHVRAIAGGATAPLVSIVWSAWAWMATNFLRWDFLLRQLVAPARKARLSGFPPPRVSRRRAFSKPVSPRSSIPHIPLPIGLACLHRILPQAPAGNHRRAERYDGQRDMYFQHAA